MRSLISNAKKYLDEELDPEIPEDAGQSIACDDSNTMLLMKGGKPEQKPEILIVGCGGTGNSVINRLFHRGFSGPRTMVIDHDKRTFEHSHATIPFFFKHLYFRKEDLGVLEGHPDIVAAAAENARPDLENQVGSPDLCIIIAGMGGNAGTGSAPAIARIAKSLGSRVTAFVTLPSRLEKTRYSRAQKGLDELLHIADSVFVLDMDYLLKMVPRDLPLEYVYSVADQVLAEVARNLYGRVCIPSVINTDFSDVKDILAKGGYGTFLIGETQEYNFVEGICNDCLNNRMADIPLSAITECIVLIEGYYAGIFYSHEIVSGLCYSFDRNAEIICGACEDHTIPEGEVRAWVLVATGKKVSIKKEET
jgi:cell division protein FtsZ